METNSSISSKFNDTNYLTHIQHQTTIQIQKNRSDIETVNKQLVIENEELRNRLKLMREEYSGLIQQIEKRNKHEIEKLKTALGEALKLLN